jgi:apolipoprotein N-acyltransferase
MKTQTQILTASVQASDTAYNLHFPVKDRFSWLWLIAGIAILAFSNGLQCVPIAAWVGPIFLLRFLRTQRALPGLVVGYVASVALFLFQWSAFFDGAGAMISLYTGVIGLLVFLPYVVDRLLHPRVRGFAGTLVLPAAWVAVEYLMQRLLPLGTFFNLAYTQSGNLPLLQIMSVTGLWAISFLVMWCASMANYAWEGGFDVRRVGRGVAVYAAVLLAVLLYGGLRLALQQPAGRTVQVAVLTTNVDKEALPETDTPLDQRLMAGTLMPEDLRVMRADMAAVNDDLLARTQREAQRGAKIVTWTEYNATVFADDEHAFLERARRLAREERIYLVFPLIVTQADVAQRPEPGVAEVNKSVMVTPDGEIAYQYVKHNLLIGPESERAVRGPRVIDAIDTPYGKLSSVICLDMEYPDFMRLAGEQGVDIMLSGAIDGTPATNGHPLHSTMASYRAIEAGFSLARGGYYGANIAVDYQGHVLGVSGYWTAGDRTVVAHLPVQGTRTLYTTLGDLFPWLCIASLVMLAVYGLVSAVAGRRADTAGVAQPAR